MSSEIRKDTKSLKAWCAQKTSDNHSRKAGWRGECVGCCLFCDVRDCDLRTCKARRSYEMCSWKRTPSEWLLGRIDEKAGKETYQRRRVEHYLRIGHKEGDSTWEGKFIARMRERYGKDFGEPEDPFKEAVE